MDESVALLAGLCQMESNSNISCSKETVVPEIAPGLEIVQQTFDWNIIDDYLNQKSPAHVEKLETLLCLSIHQKHQKHEQMDSNNTYRHASFLLEQLKIDRFEESTIINYDSKRDWKTIPRQNISDSLLPKCYNKKTSANIIA